MATESNTRTLPTVTEAFAARDLVSLEAHLGAAQIALETARAAWQGSVRAHNATGAAQTEYADNFRALSVTAHCHTLLAGIVGKMRTGEGKSWMAQEVAAVFGPECYQDRTRLF